MVQRKYQRENSEEKIRPAWRDVLNRMKWHLATVEASNVKKCKCVRFCTQIFIWANFVSSCEFQELCISRAAQIVFLFLLSSSI
jgi:hypothetical protein